MVVVCSHPLVVTVVAAPVGTFSAAQRMPKLHGPWWSRISRPQRQPSLRYQEVIAAVAVAVAIAVGTHVVPEVLAVANAVALSIVPVLLSACVPATFLVEAGSDPAVASAMTPAVSGAGAAVLQVHATGTPRGLVAASQTPFAAIESV